MYDPQKNLEWPPTSDVADHILFEAVRDSHGIPSLLQLTRLVDSWRYGQLELDPDSRKTLEAMAAKEAEFEASAEITPSWGRSIQMLIESMREELET